MAMDELLGRGLNRSAVRAPGHCVLRWWGQDVPSFSRAPFLAPALFLRCASDSFSLTKPNTSYKIEWPVSLRSDVRVHPGMSFGFPSETAFGFAGILICSSPLILFDTRRRLNCELGGESD